MHVGVAVRSLDKAMAFYGDILGWKQLKATQDGPLGRMPVALYPGMRICSFTFEQLSSKVAVPYRKKVGNKYAGQDRPLASKLASETSR